MENMSVNFKIFCTVLLSVWISVNIKACLEQELSDFQPIEFKKFVIVITSFNNKNWIEKNLESTFNQDYPKNKFRIIYIDDASTDGTADLVATYVSLKHEWHHFDLIRNSQWQGQMSNHYKAVYLCDDQEIILHLDGDDFFKHNRVLTLLNKIYTKWDIWLTYGQFEIWPYERVGFCTNVSQEIIKRNAFRELTWFFSHLRTFYAWLFKKLHLKDLLWKGTFIASTPGPDIMFMYPMIELASQGHFMCIPDVLYLYNRTNPLNQFDRPNFWDNIPQIGEWEKYKPLTEKDITISQKYRNKHADVLIFSENNPDLLAHLLQNKLVKINNIDAVVIGYRAVNHVIKKQYQKMIDAFKNIIFIDLDKSSNQEWLSYFSNDYILVMLDNWESEREYSITNCIYELERTYAFAFFLSLSKKYFTPCNELVEYAPMDGGKIEYRFAPLNNGIIAWQFAYETYVWKIPDLFSSILIRKKSMENKLNLFADNFLMNYVKLIYENMETEREIGLFFE